MRLLADDRQPEDDALHDRMQHEVGSAEHRKLRARRRGEQSAWFGLGTFGLIGWSVAVPTVLGIALGMWIDRTWPSQASWTLMLLFAGIATGCVNAWYWVVRERVEIESEITSGEPDDEEPSDE